MSEQILVRHCSPTLAGLKTGNMFTCEHTSHEDVREFIRALNHRLKKKGLRVLPLRFGDKKALIYIYRPTRLTRDLQNSLASMLLSQRGYDGMSPERCIIQLIRKLRESAEFDRMEFPHEIGLFLGYPPEDVHGFIENKDNFKCVGAWKVYGDEAAAQLTFAKYKNALQSTVTSMPKGSLLNDSRLQDNFFTKKLRQSA